MSERKIICNKWVSRLLFLDTQNQHFKQYVQALEQFLQAEVGKEQFEKIKSMTKPKDLLNEQNNGYGQ